jgi:predicted RNase H-like nuclease (RuvC/YqgF family)
MGRKRSKKSQVEVLDPDLLPVTDDEITRFVEWMGDARPMTDEMSIGLEARLNNYRAKTRLFAYILATKRMAQITRLMEAEEEVRERVMADALFYDNTDKVKLLRGLGETIEASMESVNELAGLAEAPEDILGALKEKLKEAGEEESTPEERETVRRFFDRMVAKKTHDAAP